MIAETKKYYQNVIKRNSMLGMIEDDPQLKELKKNSLKRLPRNYKDIGNMRDLRTHKHEIQRTSWTDLKAIAYEQNEEVSIKQILGIPVDIPKKKAEMPPIQNRDSIGGGGKSSVRSQISLERVERNLIQSGQKIAPIT